LGVFLRLAGAFLTDLPWSFDGLGCGEGHHKPGAGGFMIRQVCFIACGLYFIACGNYFIACGNYFTT
jgi:hypothetical protein